MAEIHDFRKSEVITLHNAITSTSGISAGVTNSNAFDTAGYSNLGLRLTGTSIDGGSATFTVQSSDDASSWVNYSMLIDNAINSSAQGLARVASKNISSNSHILLFLTPETYATYIRVVCTMSGTCTASAVLMANSA